MILEVRRALKVKNIGVKELAIRACNDICSFQVKSNYVFYMK